MEKRKRSRKLYRYDQWGHKHPASWFERLLAWLGIISTYRE